MAEQYPIHGVRFVKGRTEHRTKRPEDERWWDLLEAACGKTGFMARGFGLGPVTPCQGCHRAIYGTVSSTPQPEQGDQHGGECRESEHRK
ncbi:hypothetical protein [Streptomyces sp. NPDC094468]|uniref:hypothetical protein n=1 Tax=Streptomyces sp. NPDC094468 TaxID=3366066 RepID=UPI003827F1EF